LLQAMRDSGLEVLVGLNDDASVSALKGPARPINNMNDRIFALLALRTVDHVCLFSGRTAREFLECARPVIWIKGGDYTVDSLNLEERQTAKMNSTQVVILPAVPGKSTTAIVKSTNA